VSYGNPKLYEELAHHVIEYLKSRYHTEAPHISLLSPEYTVVAKIKSYTPRPTLGVRPEEDEDEFIPEVLAELLDPTRTTGHATHGVEATFRDFTTNSEVAMETVFYIRKAPPVEFKKVTINAKLNGDKLGVKLTVEDDDQGAKIYESEWRYIELKQGQLQAIFAFGWPDIVKEATDIISGALYPGAETVEFTDLNTIEALSTAELTKNNERFFFLPPLSKKRYADSVNYFAVQNFLYEVKVAKKGDELKVTLILRYIAPSLISRNTSKCVRVGEELGFPTYVYIGDHRDRWSIHHLMEVESRLCWKNAQPDWRWKRTLNNRQYSGLHNLIPIGALAVEDSDYNSTNNCLLLRDWHVEAEMIYPIKKSKNSVEESFQKIEKAIIQDAKSRGVKIDEEALRKAFKIVLKAFKESYPRITHLYEFQEKALYEGLKALIAGDHKAFVLQARTAGGKTLAFLLPILTYVVYAKLTRVSKEGVKTIFFYPTIALQNDQASTIFRMLWHINLDLHPETISLGLLHRYIPKRSETAEERELRLRCPLCGHRLLISWKSIPDTNVNKEVIMCSNDSCRINNPDSFEGKLLQATIKASRDAIYSSPPDLLIANPDIINARLTLMGSEDPASLAILGKHVFVCATCGALYDRDLGSRPLKCNVCKSKNIRSVRFTYPEIIVIDEAHLLRGAFGAQVAHVLTRLEQVIRRLNGLSESWRPTYFISSATLNNPKSRTRELIATDLDGIIEISAEPELEQAEPTLRIHTFLMPKLYSPEATASRIVEAIYSEASALADVYKVKYAKQLKDLREKMFGDRNPATLVFVNKISEANELLSHIKTFARDTRSDGHTTDYRDDRVRVEDEFSRGNLDIIVATSGLEVGVDFDRVDIGIIYGMPFYISDYTQRIGRIGRRQHCVIFNVFMPDKPIDHFYYKNWKILSDGSLRDIHMRSEAYRIDRENPEAISRAAQRAVLDVISTMNNTDTFLYKSIMAQNKKFEQEIMDILNVVESELTKHLPLALRISDVARAISIARQFIDEIRNAVKIHGNLIKAINEGLGASLSQLSSLRTLEPETKYKFEPVGEERSRNLLYSFRHCLPGQVISYRGNFYAVEMFSGESLRLFQTRGDRDE